MKGYIKTASYFMALNLHENIARSDEHPSFEEDSVVINTDEPIEENIEDDKTQVLNNDIPECSDTTEAENPELATAPEEDENNDSINALQTESEDKYSYTLLDINLQDIGSDRYSEAVVEAGKQNTAELNAAIQQYSGGTLTIPTGCYPVVPEIVIDNVDLDMNGSAFYTVEYKSDHTLITLRGDTCAIRNGELIGSYDVADSDPKYSFFENESLLTPSAYHYGVAVVDNMDIHNSFGYAIAANGFADVSVINDYVCPLEDIGIDEDGSRMWSMKYDISKFADMSETERIKEGVAASVCTFARKFHNYRYISAIGNVGYTYILSDKPVRYRFYDDGDTLINESNEIPRVAVEIPSGATKVEIIVFAKYAKYPNGKESAPRFNIGLFNYPMTEFTVSNSKIHNNHSLSCCGGHGKTIFKDCESYENGKPTHDAEATKRSTTGFCDVEDIQTPYMCLDHVTSHDEKSLLMDGAYMTYVTGCAGSVSAYRGWELHVDNHQGPVGHSSSETLKDLYITDAKMGTVGLTKVNPLRLHADGVSCALSDGLQYYKNFECHTSYSANSYKWNKIDSAPIGELFAENMTGTLRLQLATVEKNPYTGEETDFRLHVSMAKGYESKCGVMTVAGDCWGISSDTLLVPCGHEIHKCNFYLSDVKTLEMPVADTAAAQFCGKYSDCNFIINGVSPFRASAKVAASKPVILEFENCDFASDIGLKLFIFKLAAGSSIVFKNCKINGIPCTNIDFADMKSFVQPTMADGMLIVE